MSSEVNTNIAGGRLFTEVEVSRQQAAQSYQHSLVYERGRGENAHLLNKNIPPIRGSQVYNCDGPGSEAEKGSALEMEGRRLFYAVKGNLPGSEYGKHYCQIKFKTDLKVCKNVFLK